MARSQKAKGQKTIVLGVTGSIAAYKSAELASLLVKQNHNVFVVMTEDAVEFITPLTLQTLSKNPVMTGFYNEKENWRPGHIELADEADLLLVAPATAHVLAELAHGLAHHPLTVIALATRAPILIAPAMNGKMWEHAATQENVEKLKSRGVEFIIKPHLVAPMPAYDLWLADFRDSEGNILALLSEVPREVA